MVCHDRHRRHRQATVQPAPLHSWHHRVHRDRRTTAIGAIATAIAISAIIAAATSRGSGEDGSRRGGGGYRDGNDVSMRGRLVLNAVTHPMAVLATGIADPFESRRCPADPGHVALSPAPFTVGPRAVGRGRRFLLGPPSGVGTAVEWPPETKIRRQRF